MLLMLLSSEVWPPGGFTHLPVCRECSNICLISLPLVEVEEPASLQGPVARAPIYINGILRQEGLFDVHQPRHFVACPSGFAKSGWVS